MKLEAGLKDYNQIKKWGLRRSNTLKGDDKKIPEPTKLKHRNSVSYSHHSEFLGSLKKSTKGSLTPHTNANKSFALKRALSKKSSRPSSKSSSGVINSSLEENPSKSKDSSPKVIDKPAERRYKSNLQLFNRSNFKIGGEIPKKIDDEWESDDEGEKSPI